MDLYLNPSAQGSHDLWISYENLYPGALEAQYCFKKKGDELLKLREVKITNWNNILIRKKLNGNNKTKRDT